MSITAKVRILGATVSDVGQCQAAKYKDCSIIKAQSEHWSVNSIELYKRCCFGLA